MPNYNFSKGPSFVLATNKSGVPLLWKLLLAVFILHLDEYLATFYHSLLKSEAHHFEHYLSFAIQQANIKAEVTARTTVFREIEANLILSPDSEFRFHSGVP